jgi:hypothetical protein
VIPSRSHRPSAAIVVGAHRPFVDARRCAFCRIRSNRAMQGRLPLLCLSRHIVTIIRSRTYVPLTESWEDAMKKLTLEALKVESFESNAADRKIRGTVAGHEIDTTLHCPDSYGGTCIISACIPCYTDDPCN